MSEISVTVARFDLRKIIFQAAIVFVAYYVAGKLGQATTEIRSSNIGPVWPAYGVALAAVVLCGYRIWPVLLVAAVVVDQQGGGVPLLTGVGQGAGSVLAAVTGCFMLQRASFDPSMPRLRDVLSLVILGALGSTLISSTTGVVSLHVSGLEGYSGIAREWFIYWLGDATGALLIAPLVFAGPNFLKLALPTRMAEFAVLVGLLLLACYAVFAIKLQIPALLLLPFVVWASIRFGVGGSALTSLIVATVATVATAFGRGPFALYTPFINALLLDVFFATLSVSGLMLASLIAEREKAEEEREQLIRRQAMMEVRLRLAAIVESSEDAIVGQNTDGIITDWNAGAARLYGYDESEAIGEVFSALVRSGEKSDVDFAKMSNAVSRYETVHFRKDGTPIEVSLNVSPIHDGAGLVVGLSAIGHDITERQRAAKALRESEDKLRVILNSVAEGIFGIDSKGHCTFCNKASLRILGYDGADALLGKQMHDLIHHSHPDGTYFPAEECTHLSQVLRSPEGVHFEDEVLWRADGSSFHAELWTKAQREGERITGAVVAFSDITKRIQSEENAATLRDELAHLSRVGMLGALSGALAHEINQPLAAIRINTEAALHLLEARPLPVSDLRGALAEIRDDNQRAGEVLQHMRTLLKKDTGRLGEVEINPTVGEVVKLIKSNAVKRSITVDIELSPWMRPITGDRVQIQQVILNLLMNACDAVENNARDARNVGIKTVPRKGSMIVEVSDSGPGISDEQLEHIFEPFYTTKREGLGLGLSICQSIVAAHGGSLEAVRNPSGGMTFSAIFPMQSWPQDSTGPNHARPHT